MSFDSAHREPLRTAARFCGASLILLHAWAQAQTPAPDSADLFQRAFGQRQKASVQRIAVPIWVDEQEIGLVNAQIRGPQVELERQKLVTLLKPLLQEQVLAQLRPAAGKPERIALEELWQLGLPTTYSADRIMLEIAVPLTLRNTQSLSMRSRAEDADSQEHPVRPQPWSFIGNLRWATSMQESNGSGTELGRLRVDGGGRWHEWVMEGNGVLDSQASGRSFARQDFRLVRDWAPEAVRLMVGDVTSANQGGSASLALGGLRVARLFGLNPALSTQSLPGTTLALPKGATVDVNVNGLAANTLRLGPGVYKLSDLPVFSGANAVELTITEPGGQVSRRSFDYFFNATLLKPGLTEYDLALGYPLVFNDSGRSYDQSQRMLSAWWRRGWHENLTAGVSLQTRNGASADARLLGTDAVWSSRVGDFSGWLAQSQHEGFGGQASALQWRWISSTQEAAQPTWAASIQGSQYGEGYAPVSVDQPGSAMRDLGLRLSLSWGGSWRGSLSNLRRSYALADNDSRETALSLRHRIGPYWSAEASVVRRRQDQGQGQDTNIAILLSRSSSMPNADTSWQTSASFQSQDQRLQWDGVLSGRGSWLGSDTAWQMGANHASARSEQSDSVQMRALNGRAESSLFLSESRGSGGNLRQIEATVAGAMVASADGGWGWASPVSDSAVQFKPYKGYEGLKLLVDPQFDRALLTSDRFGTPPLPQLSAYVPRDLQLDVENLPAGRNLGNDRFTLLPAYRSVLVVPFGSNAQTRVSGQLLDKRGRSLPLQSLLLVDGSGRKIVDLFTNRKGQFTSAELPPGRYTLKQPESDAELASFLIKEDDISVINIGIVKIRGDEP